MTKISEKSADNLSEPRISVAYNKNCHLSLITSFVKHPQERAMIQKMGGVKLSEKKNTSELIHGKVGSGRNCGGSG